MGQRKKEKSVKKRREGENTLLTGNAYRNVAWVKINPENMAFLRGSFI